MHERFYSTAELARICGVSISTIKRWTDGGLLRCVRTPGGHRKFRLQDVAEAARRLESSMVMVEPQDAARVDELTLLLLQHNRDSLARKVAETLAQGDAMGCRRWFTDLHRHGMPAEILLGEVFGAALRLLDDTAPDEYSRLRARGAVEFACRHLATQFPPAGAEAPRALLAQERRPGTLWLAFALLLLRENGWDVVDLGAGASLDTLREGAHRERPRLLILATPMETPMIRSFRQELHREGVGLWLLHENLTSLQGLASELRSTREDTPSGGARPADARDEESEIFSVARRLS